MWLLPAASSVCDAVSDAKDAFLTAVIGAQGAENYHRIIDFMRPRASAVIDESAWYLSILGVADLPGSVRSGQSDPPSRRARKHPNKVRRALPTPGWK